MMTVSNFETHSLTLFRFGQKTRSFDDGISRSVCLSLSLTNTSGKIGSVFHIEGLSVVLPDFMDTLSFSLSLSLCPHQCLSSGQSLILLLCKVQTITQKTVQKWEMRACKHSSLFYYCFGCITIADLLLQYQEITDSHDHTCSTCSTVVQVVFKL